MKSLRIYPVVLILTALAAAVALLGWYCLGSPTTAYLPEPAPARWIVYPNPGEATLHPDVELDTVFSKTFECKTVPAHATLHIRSLSSCRVQFNDQPVALQQRAPNWKQDSTTNVTPHAGENHLAVTVTNSSGPPALWLWLELPEGNLISDTSWQCSLAGAADCPARLADDPLPGHTYDALRQAPRLSEAFPRVWRQLTLFGIAALAIVLAGGFFLRRGQPDDARLSQRWARLLLAVLVGAGLMWTALFYHNRPWVNRGEGFDADAHLAYIQYVRTHLAIPFADQGWEMYQAPLYYILAAMTIGPPRPYEHSPAVEAVTLLRLLNLALGLVNLGFLLACLRLIFPREPRRQLGGFLLGACLPMELYLFQFPTNEVLATTTTTAAVYFCLRMLGERRWLWRDALWLGLALGIAMLAKVSAVIVVAAALVALAIRAMDGPSPPEAPEARPAGKLAPLGAIGLVILATLAISGWYYGQVWARFGKPLVGNWDTAAVSHWWQDPGLRTSASYLHFGRALSDPIFVGFAGVWDGLYSTLWGDTLCGGSRMVTAGPWSYDLVVVGMALGLLPTLAIIIGAAAAILRFIRRPSAVWVFLLGLAFLVALAILVMTVIVPSYAQAKAFYGLVALVPLCALGGLGVDLLGGRWKWSRGVVLALLVTWAITSAATYRADADDVRMRTAAGSKLAFQERFDEAVTQYRAALQLDPSAWNARTGLAGCLMRIDPYNPQITQLLEAAPPARADTATRHLMLAQLLMQKGQTSEAAAELDRGTQVDPDDAETYAARAKLYRDAGDMAQTIACLRQALRVSPFSAPCHVNLADTYAQLGQEDMANRQVLYAQRLFAAKARREGK